MGRLDLDDIAVLTERVRRGTLDPLAVVDAVVDGIAGSARPEAWLHVLPVEALRARARALAQARRTAEALPLLGVPFAVKDNIDVGGVPTTAGCPAYAYVPAASAPVVARLEAAGAIVVGKTHMDQFATGLVGTRSPHGPCRNANAPAYIAGGSSSGSAVVVAQGLVSFALGTDTAGSGRVPAALNGVVGLKPTRGRISTRGVVPACASLDCVSIFARRCGDAARVLDVAAGGAADDPTVRPAADEILPREELRVGVPAAADLDILDDEGRRLFADAVARLDTIGARARAIDFTALRAVSDLLYAGPWIAERQLAVGDFLAAHPDAVDPVVAAIVGGAAAVRGRDVFRGLQALARLRHEVAPLWATIDLLVVPPAPRAFTIAEVQAEPRATNDLLGRFNNFVNLLDLAGCTVPTGVRACGVPFGVTLCAPAMAEPLLLDVGARLEGGPRPSWRTDGRIALAVVGAHLRGQPLNHEIVDLGGWLERATRTSADYRLHVLAGTRPPKPGLCRVQTGGVAIEAEVWSLPAAGFGRFVSRVPRPLAIGHVTLEDGTEVAGFVCEPAGLTGAPDISHLGGWRAYVAQR